MSTTRFSRPHLLASLLAPLILGLVIVLLPGMLQVVAHRGTGILMIQPSLHKDLGLLLQRQAFRDPHVLPVYGSSELALLPYPTRPDKLFADGGTGFQVCSVGRGGCTSLVMAEKLAALGPELEGKKLVVIMSYPWFYRGDVWPAPYAGNFSELEVVRIVTSSELGDDLRRRFASRMLDLPESLKDHKDLEKALGLVKNPEAHPWRTTLKMAWLHLRGLELLGEDYACTLTDLLVELPKSKPLPDLASLQPAPPGSLPGEQGSAPASAVGVHSVPDRPKAGRNDDFFATLMDTTREWEDFELLLDTLARFKAKPLFIAIPMDGTSQDQNGVSQHTRNKLYYNRMAERCARHGFAFECLPEQEYNPAFLHLHRSHISEEGWPYVNQVLDAFYHDRFEPKKTLPVGAFATPAPPPSRPISLPPPSPVAALPPDDPLTGGAAGQEISFPLPGGLKISFRFCPPGEFTMGSPVAEAGRDDDENPVPVRLTCGYWLATTECTQAQWHALKPLPATHYKGNDLPLENASWTQVQGYLKELNAQLHLPRGWTATLPTEAQWERACRAGGTGVFSFGDMLDGSQANCMGTTPYGTSGPGRALKKTVPAGSYPPNAWGLQDMHGNVWEFCSDWYSPALPGGVDPQGPATGTDRVVRGGSWNNFAVRCRSASRNFSDPGVASSNVGFRPALVYVADDRR